MNKQNALKALDGKTVIRTIKNHTSVEEMKKGLLELLEANNIPAEQLMYDGIKFYIKDGDQFWMKPKNEKVTEMLLVKRSKFITVDGCRAEIKNIKMLSPTSFETEFATYELKED